MVRGSATRLRSHIPERDALWARTCLDAKAGDEGYAMICHGDYAFARAFNPKIEMVRDKTLMQGAAYCNHRYQLKV